MCLSIRGTPSCEYCNVAKSILDGFFYVTVHSSNHINCYIKIMEIELRVKNVYFKFLISIISVYIIVTTR